MAETVDEDRPGHFPDGQGGLPDGPDGAIGGPDGRGAYELPGKPGTWAKLPRESYGLPDEPYELSDQPYELSADPDDYPDPYASGIRRWVPLLALAAFFLAIPAVAFLWLFRDDLLYPFGDPRACAGSDTELSSVIAPGGVPIPRGATDVHYLTKGTSVTVSFRTTEGDMRGYLDRADLVPAGADPFDDTRFGVPYAGGYALPAGLCGSGLAEPEVSFSGALVNGNALTVVAERSPTVRGRFRSAPRVVIETVTAGGRNSPAADPP